MFSRKSLLAATLALAAIASALAKGNFQAEGFVSDVRVEGTILKFRNVGSLSLTYATAPAGSPQAVAKNLELDAVDVPVQIENWTERHDPAKRAETPDVARVAKSLSELARTQRKALVSIDNPMLAFSNLGQLTHISGSYVYARESPN